MCGDGSARFLQRNRLCTFLALLCICVAFGSSNARHLMPLSERVDIDTIPDADDGDPRNRATIQALFQTIREAAPSETVFSAPVGPPPPQALQFQIVQGARGLEVLPLSEATPPVYYGPPPAAARGVDSPPPAPDAPGNGTINSPPGDLTPPMAPGMAPPGEDHLSPPIDPSAPLSPPEPASPPVEAGTPPAPESSSPAPPGASDTSPPVDSSESSPPVDPATASPPVDPSVSTPPAGYDESPPTTPEVLDSPPTDPLALTPPPDKSDLPFNLPPGLAIIEEPPALPDNSPPGDETMNTLSFGTGDSLQIAPPPPAPSLKMSSIDLGVTSGGGTLGTAPLAMVIVSTIAAFALLAGMALSYYLVAGSRVQLEGSENSETSAGRSPSGDVPPDLYPGFVASERPSARSNSLDEDHNRTLSGRIVSSFLRAMPLRGLAHAGAPRAGEQFTIYTNDAAEQPVLLNPSELNRINRAAAAVAHIKTLQAAAKSPRRFRGAGPSTIETRTPTNLTMETHSPTHVDLPMV